MGFENWEISWSKNPSLASTTVRNLNGVHEELQNKDPVSKEEIKELENELLQINIRDDIKERIHKNFLKIVSNTVLNRADLNILKKQISISKFRDNEVFSPPGEFSKLEGYLIKYTHSPLSKGTKERTSVEKFIAEFLYICTKRGTEGNPELPLTLEEIKTVIYTNISKDQKLILVLADFFKYTWKDKFVFLIKPNNAENLPFNFTIYKTAFDREQNSQSQIQSIQNNTSKESSKKAINGNGYTKNKDKKSDQQFKNLNIPQPKNILVTKEKWISKKEENNAKINSRNTEKTIEPESNDQEIYQKLSALGFPGNKEWLIQYQVARKFIKNAKSPWAGKVWKLTKKNIEAAYQILTIAQKESEWKIISKKLLKEEYVQYYPNKKNKKEWDKNFKLRDFILKNGLPESTQKILFDLLKDVYGSIKIQNHTQQILESYNNT